MPILGALLVSLFGGVATFLSQFLVKKAAFAVAAIAAFSLLTVGLYVGMSALLTGLLLVFPETGPVILTFIWVAVPDVVPVAVSAMIAADTASALYRWNTGNLRLATQA